jgi:hypothetical protein
MGKFTNILKKILVVWGAISLSFILILIIWAFITSRTGNRAVEKEKDIVYEKKSEGIKLTVTRKMGKQAGEVLVSLTKGERALVSNYQLPVKKYSTEWLQIRDSKIIPVSENEYRVILYSTAESDDESTDYLWFLKYNNQMNVVQVIDMEGMHKIDDQDTIFLGNKHIYLPYAKGFDHGHFVIPIEVRVGDTIRISPLLSQNGIELLKKVFDKEAQKRMEKFRKEEKNEMLKINEKSLKKFSEAIVEKSIPY